MEAEGTAGVDPLDAERRAVAALGDARTANREYRRVLLTESEAKLLRGMTAWRLHQVIGILFVAIMVIYAISVRTSQLNFLFAAVAIEGALSAIRSSSIRAGWVVRILRWGNGIVFYAMWFST